MSSVSVIKPDMIWDVSAPIFGIAHKRPSLIKQLFISFLVAVSLYLSFKVNNGFNLWSFLIASLFPYYYIIYVLATKDLRKLLPEGI